MISLKNLCIFFVLFFAVISLLFLIKKPTNPHVPVIAIANWGPHSSLHEAIQGMKDHLAQAGFKDNETIQFDLMDVQFDQSLIHHVINRIIAIKPTVVVALSTPIAQAAKNMIKDIPIIFSCVTDPVAAELLIDKHHSNDNITGATDMQDMQAVLSFSKELIPSFKRIGLFYSMSEANDAAALLSMINEAAALEHVEVIAIPIHQSHDIPLRMSLFKDAVDCIYVGSSGAVQPSLPTIVAAAEEMKIPVINVNAQEVRDHKVLASFGVSYYQVGIHTGMLVEKLLHATPISKLPPLYPSISDYEKVISTIRANAIGFTIPSIPDLSIVE